MVYIVSAVAWWLQASLAGAGSTFLAFLSNTLPLAHVVHLRGGGVSFTHVFNPGPAPTGSWTTFTGTYTIPGGTDLTDGISFLIEAVCGAVSGCSVTMNIDNVSVTLNP